MTQITHNERALYMAIDVGVKNWKISLSDMVKERDISINVCGCAVRLAEEVSKAKQKFGLAAEAPVYSCYEAGRDGFWIHRMLTRLGITNFVVDPASIEVNRRARRVKTDRLDAQKLRNMLIRYVVQGERKHWRVLHVPDEDAEAARRMGREEDRLKKERGAHICRIRSLLALQGIRVKSVKCDILLLKDWDGRPLSEALREEIAREQQRLEFVDRQLEVLKKAKKEGIKNPDTDAKAKAARLIRLKGIGEDTAWDLSHEFFGWRKFNNRRQVGSAAGLTGCPYNSGNSNREQGISKAGNRRIRTSMVETAWRWLQFQPNSELSKWYMLRFAGNGKRMRRIGIVGLARKLLVAIWKYVEFGTLPEGAIEKAV